MKYQRNNYFINTYDDNHNISPKIQQLFNIQNKLTIKIIVTLVVDLLLG